MKRTSLALLTALALTPAAQAAFVPIICVIDQPGQINALVNADGEITAVTKLNRDPTKEIYPSQYRDDESGKERYGAATATFTVNMRADNCGFDNTDVVTLKSTNASKPWQQFQMGNDNDRSKVLSRDFVDDVYQPVPLLLSEGKQPGDALPTPQAFEYSANRFAPVYSIDTLLRQVDSEYASEAEQQGWFETKPGQLPPAVVGEQTLHIDADGNPWLYRLTAASQDGAIAVGYMQRKAEADAEPTDEKPQRYTVIWELGRAAAALEESDYQAEITNELVFYPSASLVSQYYPVWDETGYPYPLDAFDQLDTNLTMSKVSQIISYGPNEYLIAGQSASGQPMLAIVSTNFWRGHREPI